MSSEEEENMRLCEGRGRGQRDTAPCPGCQVQQQLENREDFPWCELLAPQFQPLLCTTVRDSSAVGSDPVEGEEALRRECSRHCEPLG